MADAPQSNSPLDVAPTATDLPTVTPPALATKEPASTDVPALTATPGSMVMDSVVDTPTSESAAPVPSAPQYASGDGERWIDVFFFSSRRRHTRLTCDWSSDVCSSD